MIKGNITKIIKNSSVDGPGNRIAIFLQGCNFDCVYCHNPETIAFDEKLAESIMTSDELVKYVMKYRRFISGVTFSGGECTMQCDFLLEVCEKLHDLGIHILIDTNGSLKEEKMIELAKVVDGFMIDIKESDPVKNQISISGTDFPVVDLIKRNVELTSSLNKLYEVRTVVVGDVFDGKKMAPNSIFDAEETVDVTSKYLGEHSPDTIYKLISYRQNGVRKDRLIGKTPDVELMEKLEEICIKNGLKTVVKV